MAKNTTGNVWQQGGKNAFNVNDTVQVTDWNDDLADIFLDRNNFYPLIMNLGMGSHETINAKFNWGEYDRELPTATVTDTASGAVNVSTITVTGTEYKALLANDILHDPVHNVYLMVYETSTTTDVKCNVLDSTSITGITADDAYNGYTFYRITNATANGSMTLEANLNKISYFKTVADEYNYIQQIEDYAKIGNTVKNQQWQFKNMTQWEHMQRVSWQEHHDQIEGMCWSGLRFTEDTQNATGITGSRGFFNFGIGSQTGTMGAFSWRDFMTYARTVVNAKNDKMVLDAFVNPWMNQWIAEMAENTSSFEFNADAGKDQFGIRIAKLVTPEVTLILRTNRKLKELYPDKAVMATMDLSKAGLRYLSNSNTRTRHNVQPAIAEFVMDKTISNLGFELHNAANHSKLVLS